MSKTQRYHLTGVQQFFLVLLRIGIGWHFLREGWVKLCHPTWTAIGYLNGSWGPLSPYFREIAGTEWMLNMSNFMMPWLLFLAGLGLMLGLFTRTSIVVAAGLLAMFYAAAPPIEAMPPYDKWMAAAGGFDSAFSWGAYKISLDHALWAGQHMIGNEGNFVIVNKNLVELLALLALLMLDTGRMIGLDAIVRPLFSKPSTESASVKAEVTV